MSIRKYIVFSAYKVLYTSNNFPTFMQSHFYQHIVNSGVHRAYSMKSLGLDAIHDRILTIDR
jgi:hypothetical protein